MDALKIYSVSDDYISYLKERMPNIYSNKADNRTHTRKYIGVVIEMNGFKYYIPLSSPKDSDYQVAGGRKVIKKSIVPIIRIVAKNPQGMKELKGTLRISHMIPVPESELEPYNLNNEPDEKYRNLVWDEMLFIRQHTKQIIGNAALLHKQKMNGDTTAGYVKVALDYKEIEILCREWEESGADAEDILENANISR